MILISIDLETTGLDVVNDRVTEVGAILYSTSQNRCLESVGFLVKTDVAIPEVVIEKTKIHPAMCKKFGFSSLDALENLIEMVNVSDAIIGQNVIRFDKRVIEEWAKREQRSFPDKLWIDTRTDLPGVEGKTLQYMAADQGFLNPFPHAALTDCLTVIRLVSQHNIDDVVARAKSQTIVLIAKQDRSENHLAKERKFRWSPTKKVWWKIIKEMDFTKETTDVPFQVAVAPPTLLVEELMYE